MRTHLKVVLAAAAVLAVMAGGALVRGPLADGSATAGPSVLATPSALPAPPDGSRWVGMDDVVVAVPDWWTTGETQCLAPVEDTVYFDSSSLADCADPADPATVREVSALAVLDGRSGYGEAQLRSMSPVAGNEGLVVVERAGCEEWFPGVCRRLFGLPSLRVVFAVTLAEEGDGDYAAIRDSVRVLPDGLTTVPLDVGSGFTPGYGTEPSLVDDVVIGLERAGLVVDVQALAPTGGRDLGLTASLPRGSLLEVSPSPGSVIEDGGAVTLTVAG